MLSQNGWNAGTTAASIGVQSFTVAGVSFPVKSGDVTTVLQYVAQQFHSRIEPLHQGWCWGYSYRPVRGATVLSNHSSGTAIDINAPDHPLGVKGTFGSAKVRAIRAIVDECGGAVFWGGDFDNPSRGGGPAGSRVDEMHWEINCNATKLAAIAARLRQPAPLPVPAFPDTEEDDMSGALLRYVKGDGMPNIYLVRYGMGDDGFPPASRRSVDGTEWAIVSQTGTKVAVLPQKQFDAIPILGK